MKTKSLKLTLTKLADVQDELKALLVDNPDGAFSVKINKWSAKRALSANAQQHVWYGQIAKHRGDISSRTAKMMCKAMFGIPVMLESVRLNEKTEYLINKLEYYNSEYPFQLELAEIICHTSDFDTSESKTYMDLMIEYWNDNGCFIGYKG